MKQLTEKEEELMRKLWTKSEMTARELLEMYPEPRPHFNTVSTVLRVLQQKGWVSYRPIGNTHLYRATVSEEEMGKKSLKSIVSKFFNGSLKGMVSSLLKDEPLSKEEIKELMEIIEKKKD
ncbi:MAG: BlaI/MecI/CopY family transcriptional regulator [Muribaculaceae bacterium]|nr:BlaI/MecI/CopY family transcriptional regulator [Muribaculaceae bacterium]